MKAAPSSSASTASAFCSPKSDVQCRMIPQCLGISQLSRVCLSESRRTFFSRSVITVTQISSKRSNSAPIHSPHTPACSTMSPPATPPRAVAEHAGEPPSKRSAPDTSQPQSGSQKKRQISVSSPKVTFPRFPPLKLPPSPAPGGLRPRSPRPHCLVAAIDRLLLEILVFKSPSLRQASLLSLAICPPWHPPSGKRLLHNQIDKPA